MKQFTSMPTPTVEMLKMAERSELAERIERSPFGRGLSAADIELIVAALRAHALPSEEEIARTIDSVAADWGSFKLPSGLIAALARAVLALLSKTGGEK